MIPKDIGKSHGVPPTADLSVLKDVDVSQVKGKQLAMVGRNIKLLTSKEIKTLQKDQVKVITNLDDIAKAILETKIDFSKFNPEQLRNFFFSLEHIENKAPSIFKNFMKGRKVIDEKKAEMFKKWQSIGTAALVHSAKPGVASFFRDNEKITDKNWPILEKFLTEKQPATLEDLQYNDHQRNDLINYLDKHLQSSDLSIPEDLSKVALLKTLIALNFNDKLDLIKQWEEEENKLKAEQAVREQDKKAEAG